MLPHGQRVHPARALVAPCWLRGAAYTAAAGLSLLHGCATDASMDTGPTDRTCAISSSDRTSMVPANPRELRGTGRPGCWHQQSAWQVGWESGGCATRAACLRLAVDPGSRSSGEWGHAHPKTAARAQAQPVWACQQPRHVGEPVAGHRHQPAGTSRPPAASHSLDRTGTRHLAAARHHHHEFLRHDRIVGHGLCQPRLAGAQQLACHRLQLLSIRCRPAVGQPERQKPIKAAATVPRCQVGAQPGGATCCNPTCRLGT